MIFRTTPLLTTLLFVLSMGLSPLVFAANPVWDSNYVYNKKIYDATSTGGLKKGIRLNKVRAHKRSRKSKGSMRFALIPNKCIRNPTSKLGEDDCDRGIRRSQLRSHAGQRMNRKLEYRFSVKKLYRKSYGVLDDDGNRIKTLINMFEIKPKYDGKVMTIPIFSLYLEPKSLKLSVILSRSNHNISEQDDVTTYNIGRLKAGWNDFRIKTMHTTKRNGYVRLYQNGKLIYSYKGKTSYRHNDIRYWIGLYICCGEGDRLHKKEPTHLFFYDMVKVRVLK